MDKRTPQYDLDKDKIKDTLADFSSIDDLSSGGSIFTRVTPDRSTMSWIIRPLLPITLPVKWKMVCYTSPVVCMSLSRLLVVVRIRRKVLHIARSKTHALTQTKECENFGMDVRDWGCTLVSPQSFLECI